MREFGIFLQHWLNFIFPVVFANVSYAGLLLEKEYPKRILKMK